MRPSSNTGSLWYTAGSFRNLTGAAPAGRGEQRESFAVWTWSYWAALRLPKWVDSRRTAADRDGRRELGGRSCLALYELDGGIVRASKVIGGLALGPRPQ